MPHGALWSVRFSSICLLILILDGITYAQQPPLLHSVTTSPVIANHSLLEVPVVPESDCFNGIDDNNNGLTDMKDFHCYFNSQSSIEDCIPTKIIWASSNWGLHWIDLETKEQRLVSAVTGHTFDDLTWSSNGKLYGAERWGGIYEIDPYTYQSTFVGEVEGHYYSNGMTADVAGMLYLSSYTNDGKCNVVKFDVANRKTEIIISLSSYGLWSSGDMCFMNGYLFVACNGNVIARISMADKKLTKLYIINSPVLDGTYGMTTLGDGYLYISNNMGDIYRVDPSTMKAAFYMAIPFPNLFILGFTSYADLCNAPGCRANVKISTERLPPYCSNVGVPPNSIRSRNKRSEQLHLDVT